MAFSDVTGQPQIVTALQRAATNDLPIAAEALLEAGADPSRPSGLEYSGDSARVLAMRFRKFDIIRAIQGYERRNGIPLPEGEFEL